MLLLLVSIGGDLANQILATIDPVSIVQNVALKMGISNNELTCQSLKKSCLAC
jgi:hypothetical protein